MPFILKLSEGLSCLWVLSLLLSLHSVALSKENRLSSNLSDTYLHAVLQKKRCKTNQQVAYNLLAPLTKYCCSTTRITVHSV